MTVAGSGRPAAITILPYGPLALMLEVDDTAAAVDLAGWLRAPGSPDAIEVVPGARTVLVRCRDRDDRARVEAALADYRQGVAPAADGPLVEVPVVYDGADLVAVAAALGCATDEVIERHSCVVYTAAFCGFTPGFTYLTGLDPVLRLPRRATPRARIPAGSLAIGADFTSIYPTASPGGWHLLGHTDAVVWDIGRSQPALIPPGCRVRFVVDTGQR